MESKESKEDKEAYKKLMDLYGKSSIKKIYDAISINVNHIEHKPELKNNLYDLITYNKLNIYSGKRFINENFIMPKGNELNTGVDELGFTKG
tara:strand:- start:37504 stop:37779 length:276 start_codon:yes stop_codon:yes gene_type:complete